MMKRVAALSSAEFPVDCKASRQDVCLICKGTEDSDQLTPISATSWDKLCEYGQKWKQLSLAGADVSTDRQNLHKTTSGTFQNDNSYHRSCYQHVTMKSHFDRLQAKISAIPFDKATIDHGIPSTTRSSISISSDLNKCIVCQTDKKQKNDRRKFQSLQSFEMEQASSAFIEAANTHKTTKNGHRIWAALEYINFDLFASEVKYHKNCIDHFKRDHVLERLKAENLDVSSVAYEESFRILISELDKTVMKEHNVITMNEILTRYSSILNENGVKNCDLNSGRVKRKLKHWFGNQIGFWLPKNRSISASEFIFCANVETGSVIESGITGTLAEDSTHQLYELCKKMRDQILSMKSSDAWPPRPQDMVESQITIPPLVYNMLAWIVSSAEKTVTSLTGKVQVGPMTHRQVLSIAQDLVYCSSNGEIVMPKQIALPWTVRQTTGSTEVVRLLNRFGHGVSNEYIREAETTIAEILSESEKTVIPESLCVGEPVTIAYDNTDINQETLSGGGTFHGTSGCIIQNSLNSLSPPIHSKSRTRRRSFTSCQKGIQPYYAGKRPKLQSIDVPSTHASTDLTSWQQVLQHNLMYMLHRSPSSLGLDVNNAKKHVPSWTGFNHNVSNEVPLKSIIEQVPVTSQSSTDISVVYSLLQHSNSVRKDLKLDFIFVVSDHVIFSKMVEVLEKDKELSSHIILRMGGFHLIMNFASIIGTRFGIAGLKDLMIESGVVAAGSVDSVLCCKQYNRCIRSLKLVYEAFSRMKFAAFKDWIESRIPDSKENPDLTNDENSELGKEDEANNDDSELKRLLSILREKQCPKSAEDVMNSKEFCDMFHLWTEFEKADHGPMFEFWDSFVGMCEILLGLIRSYRDSDWELNLLCIRKAMPYMFAYDHHNYARYLPYYWSKMTALKSENPRAYNYLADGGFAAQLTDMNKFSRVPLDYVVEKANRAMKVKGGIVMFSNQQGAVDRWVLTQHVRSSVQMQCLELAGLDVHRHNSSTADLSPKRMERDLKDVQAIVQTIEDWGTNPFLPCSEISVLSSGATITGKQADDLLGAEALGEKLASEFIEDRLKSSKIDFYSPIKKTRIGSLLKPKSKGKANTRDDIVKADRNTFARMTIIGQNRQLNMKEILKFPLSSVPPSLTTSDGRMYKTRKSNLCVLLESFDDSADDKVKCSCVILDAMAILHSHRHVPGMWKDVARSIFNLKIEPLFRGGATRIDFVSDVYAENSIKDVEHERRATDDGALKIKISGRDQKSPLNHKNWSRFLSDAENKTALVSFLASEWSTEYYVDSLDCKELYVTVESKCMRICDNAVQESTRLICHQEEADTKIVFHVNDASHQGHKNIAVHSPDTDVEILLIAFSAKIGADIYFKSGSTARPNLISINSISNNMEKPTLEGLLGFHAFTGCDTVEAFVNKGKIRPFNLIQKQPVHAEILGKLGESLHIMKNKGFLTDVYKFVCGMYGDGNTSDLAKLRYRLLAKNQTASHLLPPTENQVLYHTLRANYQTYLWKNSLQTQDDIASPDGNGWVINSDGIGCVWTDQRMAPAEIMEMVSCVCSTKSGCQPKSCSCLQQGLPCTDACKCDSCEYVCDIEDVDGDDGDEDNDSESDADC